MAAVTTRRPGEQAPAPDASVLAYARFHHICRDHTRDDPLDSRHLPQAPIFLAQELSDPSGCPGIQLTQPPGTSERLEIDSTAAHVLKSVSALRFPPQVTEAHSLPRLTRQLKVETPLLRTDHELDSIRFRKRDFFSLKNVTLPLEHTDDEQDEGLTWPSRCHNFSGEFHNKIASDRIDVQKQTLLYLQSVMMRPDKPEIPDSAPEKRRVVQPVTPPLLPLSPEFTHVPDPSSSSPTGQLQLLSGTTNSTAAEAEALEAEIMKKDKLEESEVPGLKYYTEDPMLWDDAEGLEVDAPEFSLKTRRRAADMKVEVPLTPPAKFPPAFQSPAKKVKSVSFPEEILEHTTNPMEIPSQYEDGNAVLDSENDFDAFFEDIAPIAKKADWRAEHEQLQEADTTKRVEVPRLDFEAPVAPWHAFGLKASLKKEGVSTELKAQARLLSRCAKEELKLAHRWPESKKQDGELTWWAFPRNLHKAAVAERIQYDAALDQLIGSSASKEDVDIVESGSLAWKLDGLRILDKAEDEDEEILPWCFEPGDDFASLLQKRKLEMAEPQAESVKTPTVPMPKESIIHQHQKRQKTNENTDLKTDRVENGFMLGGMFSTSSSLDQFMQINSGAMNVEKRTELRHPAKKQEQEVYRDEAAIPDTMEQAAGNTQTPTPIPAPPITKDQPPKPFIISSSLLIQRRELVHAIQKLYPRATLIERDFSKSLSTSTPNPHVAEPDLLLSPSTGLIITTLQRIKQRPLPGQQSAAASFQAELAQRAAKLQHLIVLISASLDIATTLPDASDCEALASLQGFAASSRCHITIVYVPGSETDLARWIVGTMEVYGKTSAELAGGGGGMKENIGDDGGGDFSVLKEEESLWELFLRRAGLNAFAAQVVLVRLKKDKGAEGGSGDGSNGEEETAAPYGLGQFVGMDPEERMKAFEGIVADRELLDLVGRRVDGTWTKPGP
ncbi:hypothetical protein BK809_0003406 [Diplodia seriata]|uniref:Nucleoporin nup49 n=1 Tax=Diplodia seriata TaxID=420778 RepID=A0A1S8BFM3_9PEZI|nr:hypothetical protein BK809_0003406 [Diplodia seriata]